MLSPTINDIILRLFDNASHGAAPLLGMLQDIFQCESIHISTSLNQHMAANDVVYQADDEWPIKKSSLTLTHPSFKQVNPESKQLTLVISEQESVYLNILFHCPSLLKQCLYSEDIRTLIPHIQQAILIADKISQQQGDINSINYVNSHHPCLILSKPESLYPEGSLYLPGLSKDAANSNIDLTIERELLVRLFKFTPSEAELAKLLFKGLSLQEIAEYRCVSKQTIRKQLQSILKKTHCDSQEALILTIFDAVLTSLKIPATKDTSNERVFIEH